MVMVEEIMVNLEEVGYEVFVDDCKEWVGVKFVDVDLIGVLIWVMVGKKVGEGIVEIKICKIGEILEVYKEELVINIVILFK